MKPEITISERPNGAIITIEFKDGQTVRVEAFDEKNVLRINSGMSDLTLKSRTCNEIDVIISES